MTSDTLRLLEFDQLLRLLASYISSPLGRAKLAVVAPETDIEKITARQQLAAEAREYLRASAGSGGKPVDGGRTLPLNFSGFDDPEHALQKAAVEGTVLETSEIVELLRFAER